MATKKTTSPEAVGLEALALYLTDASPRVMFGSKTVRGIFPSKAKATQEAAKVCEAQGWLEKTATMVGKGKSAQHLYRLSAAGVAAVLSRSGALEILKALHNGMGALEATARAIPAQVAALQAEVGELRTVVDRTRSAVESGAAKLQPPDLDQIAQKINAGAAAPPAPPAAHAAPGHNGTDLEHEIQAIVRSWRARGERGDCPLPEIYQQLRAKHHTLSVGAFHDLVRKLRDEHKLNLTHWALPLMELPDSDVALVTAHKVMYYASLPE